MRDEEGLRGVDGTSAVAEPPAGVVPRVAAAPATVAVGVPGAVPVAAVEGPADDVLVGLQGVVLGAADAAHVVGVAVPATVLVKGVAGHLDKVGRGVAVAGHAAQVQVVAEVVVAQDHLP